MSREYLADKQTLDTVNEKMGDAGGSSIFAKLNSIIGTIADHIAIWTAAKAENLDTTVSSRAPASTALSTAQWTSTRAGYLDNINTKANNLDSRLTATRAGYLDKLNSGVTVNSLSDKIIKSVQRGTIAISEGKKEATITISSVNINKAIVVFCGSALTIFSGYTDAYAPASLVRLELTSATQIKATRYDESGAVTASYQVIEFY